MSSLRIGVDVGGTKIEAVAIDPTGGELARRRVPSPSHDYAAMVEAVRDIVLALEREVGGPARIGVGMPGAVSATSGRVKNANSTVLNGQPFSGDLSSVLGRELRVENDANCFALSEARDGAGQGHGLVFGVILGTGVGGGIVHDGRLWRGAQAIAGEWGHNEMPSRAEAGLPETRCWCGRRRCIETYLSGPGLAADHARATGAVNDAASIVELAAGGDPDAGATMARYSRRLAAALGSVIDVLDPDVVVFGGGVSNAGVLYEQMQSLLAGQVFSDRCQTPVLKNRHGAASGVRGAAWLWPAFA